MDKLSAIALNEKFGDPNQFLMPRSVPEVRRACNRAK